MKYKHGVFIFIQGENFFLSIGLPIAEISFCTRQGEMPTYIFKHQHHAINWLAGCLYLDSDARGWLIIYVYYILCILCILYIIYILYMYMFGWAAMDYAKNPISNTCHLLSKSQEVNSTFTKTI